MIWAHVRTHRLTKLVTIGGDFTVLHVHTTFCIGK